jgi:2-haloalkanoic acid dehalogenase type II
VNETLLDLKALEPQFEEIFGRKEVLTEWFGTVLRLAFVATITGEYHDFSATQGAALQMIAEREGIELSEDARGAVAEGARRLPPHPEVAEGLGILKRAGRRLITLTNSPPAVLEEQLTNAGLADFFEQRLSIDAVGRLKPAPEAYRARGRYARCSCLGPTDRRRARLGHRRCDAGGLRGRLRRETWQAPLAAAGEAARHRPRSRCCREGARTAGGAGDGLTPIPQKGCCSSHVAPRGRELG